MELHDLLRRKPWQKMIFDVGLDDEPRTPWRPGYDKISREDILAHAYAQCRSNKGAPGVDRQDFEDIEAYTDPDVRNSRIRFFTREIRSRRRIRGQSWLAAEDGVLAGEGWGEGKRSPYSAPRASLSRSPVSPSLEKSIASIRSPRRAIRALAAPIPERSSCAWRKWVFTMIAETG